MARRGIRDVSLPYLQPIFSAMVLWMAISNAPSGFVHPPEAAFKDANVLLRCPHSQPRSDTGVDLGDFVGILGGEEPSVPVLNIRAPGTSGQAQLQSRYTWSAK
jgi:hypothetical protein